jgi:signal peptidase I
VLGVSTPSRGDIILFRYPMDMRQTFVKRCMGVPGDRIKLANEESARDMLEHHVVNGELAVPPGSFAMGDNRDASLDSRYWGFVPRDNIMGKALIVYWSYGAPTEVLAGSAIGIDRIVERYRNFFTKTRWRRICMPVRGYAIN